MNPPNGQNSLFFPNAGKAENNQDDAINNKYQKRQENFNN